MGVCYIEQNNDYQFSLDQFKNNLIKTTDSIIFMLVRHSKSTKLIGASVFGPDTPKLPSVWRLQEKLSKSNLNHLLNYPPWKTEWQITVLLQEAAKLYWMSPLFLSGSRRIYIYIYIYRDSFRNYRQVTKMRSSTPG